MTACGAAPPHLLICAQVLLEFPALYSVIAISVEGRDTHSHSIPPILPLMTRLLLSVAIVGPVSEEITPRVGP